LYSIKTIPAFCYSLIRTSWHLILEGGEANRNPQDFTSISWKIRILFFLKYYFILFLDSGLFTCLEEIEENQTRDII